MRLIGQIITVSLETVKLVRALPPCEEGGLSAVEALASVVGEAVETLEEAQQAKEPEASAQMGKGVLEGAKRGRMAREPRRGAERGQGTKAQQPEQTAKKTRKGEKSR